MLDPHILKRLPQEMVREAGQSSPTQASRGNRSLAIQAVHRSCCGAEHRRGPSPQTLKIPEESRPGTKEASDDEERFAIQHDNARLGG